MIDPTIIDTARSAIGPGGKHTVVLMMSVWIFRDRSESNAGGGDKTDSKEYWTASIAAVFPEVHPCD